jgi:hypothetical protein
MLSARRAACLAIALAMSEWLAAADAPLCCRIFSIDATPILGDAPTACGQVPDAETTEEAAAEKRRAAQCARDAQAQGRAFVYTYRELIPPDVDLIVQAVFGTRGERLLLKAGRFAREDVRSLEVCGALNVQPGTLRTAGAPRTRAHRRLRATLKSGFSTRPRHDAAHVAHELRYCWSVDCRRG